MTLISSFNLPVCFFVFVALCVCVWFFCYGRGSCLKLSVLSLAQSFRRLCELLQISRLPGMDDVSNIAKILQRLIRDGCSIKATGVAAQFRTGQTRGPRRTFVEFLPHPVFCSIHLQHQSLPNLSDSLDRLPTQTGLKPSLRQNGLKRQSNPAPQAPYQGDSSVRECSKSFSIPETLPSLLCSLPTPPKSS